MKQLLALSGIITVIVLGASFNAFGQESTSIPNWIKSTTKFWINGDVSDNDFENGIKYLIEHKVIKISEAQQNPQSIQRIPTWVKNLAGMWTNGQASDDDFTKGIEYLVNIGIISVNVQSNQTVSTPANSSIPTTQTLNSTTTSPTKSLIGTGINLMIANNVANGSLIINGKQYTASNLAIIVNADKITLTGQIQGTSSGILEVIGTHTTGIEYRFNGNILSNNNSIPITFTALFTNPAVPSTPNTVPEPNTPAPVSQVPKLPMLMLTSPNDRVYMGKIYNLVVRVYDPQSNPQKIFDQYNGGISDVNITATIVDVNNKIITQSSGKTDSKGGYQAGIPIPIRPSSQEQVYININATKNGYVAQHVTLPFWIMRQNS